VPGGAQADRTRAPKASHLYLGLGGAEAPTVGYASSRMPTSRYPLEPLSRLRQERLDGAERALAAAIRAREAAERTRIEALRAHQEQRRKAEALEAAERDALARGELRAEDLARSGAWALRAGAEGARLLDAVVQARRAEERSRSAEERARSAAASCAAEMHVVSAHAARWQGAQQTAQERAEEEAAVEAWRPKR
jgi:hypothetical protein